MNPSPFQLVQCPACNGQGISITKEGSLTCPTCQGNGIWLQTTTGINLTYPFASHIKPHQTNFLAKPWLSASILGLSIVSTLGSLAFIIASNPSSIETLFWQRGFSHAYLGLGGLACVGSFGWYRSTLSIDTSLQNLKDILSNLPQNGKIDLSAFSHPRVQELLKKAAELAATIHTTLIDEILLALTLIDQPRIQIMLRRLEIETDQLMTDLTSLVERHPSETKTSIQLDSMVRSLLYKAFQECLDKNLPYLDIEDLLLAILHSENPIQEVFKQHSISYEDWYAVTRWYAGEEERQQQWQVWLQKGRSRPQGFMNKAWTALPTPLLDQFSNDITRLAGNGQVGTVTVRDAEIAEILQILGRTKKNNALLVGEPGVGKETIIGAIALRMLEDKVPEILKDKRLVSLDIGALLASGGSGNENVQALLNEISQAGNVILVIPEINLLAGDAGSTLDGASLLSRALEHGIIQILSTATYADYHRYIESDATFSNLLEIIEIKEVTPENAIAVLEQEAPRIENRQGVLLTYPAIAAAVQLSSQYIPDKVLPDSALSILDEAAASIQQAKRRWVTEIDIQEAVEKKTHIPIKEANERETELLLNLEERLHQRVIGQTQAISAISNALRRSRAGLHTSKRPISSFLFIGPTGVGKTETAKAVADLYFNQEDSMVRLDMSEYQDARAVYRLIGAPAADSNSYTEGGSLTQPIREHPFSLILLDEIEKAESSVLNLFLQVLDDGRLTENTGRTVFFTNTMIVATSNAGSTEILELVKQAMPPDQMSKQILVILQNHFKPEFLNRFDAIVPFYPLRQEEINQVVSLMLSGVTENLTKQGYQVSFTPEAILKIGQLGYDPQYGARPLRRVIQDKVEGMIATLILQKSLLPNQPLQIQAEMIN